MGKSDAVTDDLKPLLAHARTKIECDVPGHGGGIVCFACDLRRLIAAALECIKLLEETQEQRCIAHAAFTAPDSECIFCDHEAAEQRSKELEEALRYMMDVRDVRCQHKGGPDEFCAKCKADAALLSSEVRV